MYPTMDSLMDNTTTCSVGEASCSGTCSTVESTSRSSVGRGSPVCCHGKGTKRKSQMFDEQFQATCLVDGSCASAATLMRSTTPAKRERKPVSNRLFDCPICGSLLHARELPRHCQMEFERLEKWKLKPTGRPLRNVFPNETEASNAQPKAFNKANATSSKKNGLQEIGYATDQTLEGIRRNRMRRRAEHLRLELPPSMSSPSSAQATQSGEPSSTATSRSSCPVCNASISGDLETVNKHIDNCLADGERLQQLGENSDVDSDGPMVEYSWAGQDRVRASALLPDGWAGLGYEKGRSCPEDEELDVDIEGVDEAMYGGAQYGENNIVPCSADSPCEELERQALRVAVMRPAAEKEKLNSDAGTVDKCAEVKHCSVVDLGLSSSPRLPSTSSHQSEVWQQFKCLVCLDVYQTPVTSIKCWHVCCESCWLRVLGAKKLCPQCNVITSPADLRRIFL